MDMSKHLPLRQEYARNIITKYHEELMFMDIVKQLPYLEKLLNDIDTGGLRASALQPSSSPLPKVCIIGAGVAGLYAGMIFDTLGIDYDILEAQPDHIGGRLLTYKFEKGGPNDYFVRVDNVYLAR
jgi:hypothetical protein